MPWGVSFPGVEGFRHPVALYDGLKNLALVPLLVVVLRRWPAGEGIATGCFLLGYGGLRFFIDFFRDYESVLLGLGPGQWFNLAMAATGAVMLLSVRRSADVSVPAAAACRLRSPLRSAPENCRNGSADPIPAMYTEQLGQRAPASEAATNIASSGLWQPRIGNLRGSELWSCARPHPAWPSVP